MNRILLGIITVSLGCGVTQVEEEKQDSAEEEIQSDGFSPMVLDADAWCYIVDNTENPEKWAFTARVDDPQGVDTVKTFMAGAVVFEDLGGTEIGSSAIACQDGGCTGSSNSTSINIGCSTPENFKAVFTILDEDGNESIPHSITCRRGSNASG